MLKNFSLSGIRSKINELFALVKALEARVKAIEDAG